MKNIFKLNLFFVGLPFFICFLGIIDPVFVMCGLLSTIAIGIFQVVFGIQMLIDEPQDKGLQVYISSVILFFLVWFINVQMLSCDFLYLILMFIPGILAIYFSILIYKKQKS
jgi:hypothetical protein